MGNLQSGGGYVSLPKCNNRIYPALGACQNVGDLIFNIRQACGIYMVLGMLKTWVFASVVGTLRSTGFQQENPAFLGVLFDMGLLWVQVFNLQNRCAVLSGLVLTFMMMAILLTALRTSKSSR